MADSLSRQFARWTANLKYEDLPPAVVDKSKAFLLHALTSAVLGGPDPRSDHAVHFTLAEEAKPDGATIMWKGGKATRLGATFANAEIMHNSGLIDSYRMLTHPGPVVVPAAIANAELEQRNGKELLTAMVAGYEFVFRLADEFIPATAAAGYRPSPVYTAMGAAVTTGKLLGLDEDGLVTTIAYVANMANALNQSSTEGGSDGAVHEPVSARTGVFAALMARENKGRLGSEHSLEGPAGFYNHVIGNPRGDLSYSFHEGKTHEDFANVMKGLGSEYKQLTAMFRMYPFAAYNQPVIDLMAELKVAHKINHEEIDTVFVHMNWIETQYPSPAYPRYPDFDTPRVAGPPTSHWYAAHSAVNGGYPAISGKTFGPTGWDLSADTKVNEFAKTHVRLVPEKDRAMFSPAITVKMKDGKTYSGEYPYHPRLEWNFDQLAKRLEDCLPGMAGGAPTLAGLVDASRNADKLTSMAPLFEAVKAR